MNLLIIRHAEAEDAVAGVGMSRVRDAERQLTDRGRRTMRKIAKGLREIGPVIDVLAASPLVRARQTAEIVSDVCRVAESGEEPLLAPGANKRELLAWLRQHPADATVAVVGHEPDLGQFAGLVVSGREASMLAFKKGACCLIEFNAAPAAGGGVLQWLLQPGQLRRLAG